MRIRHATTSDALSIAQVHVRSWQYAYRGLLTDDLLDNLSVEKRQVMWARSLANPTPSLLVAEDSDEIVGFSAFGPYRDAMGSPTVHELWALYLLPDHCSKGIGHQLWLASCAEMVSQGSTDIRVWVLAGNNRAEHFYKKAGFRPEPDSSKPLALPGQHGSETRFTLHLPSGRL
ncbi:GNAT family N-acetyltransferase [Modicisalibacter luteus]|uniref:GNAT family N-acetyltransferase n=1 Tax=Modicisalibacter luteus TaxID=453962 RepID=A0ABV7M4Y9_9GAMM|nr:N-acetyltransferase [Halomonas lutea]